MTDHGYDLTDDERLERIAELATTLLVALQPWEIHGQKVRSSAARLTVALAAIPETSA